MNTFSKKSAFIILVLGVLCSLSFGANAQQEGWRLLEGKEAAAYPKADGIGQYQLYVLDTIWMKNVVEHGELAIPDPENNRYKLLLEKSNLLAPALQNKFPNLEVWDGKAENEAHFHAKINRMGQTLHLQVFQNGKLSYYIDPLGTDYPTLYLVYFIKDLTGNTKLDERH